MDSADNNPSFKTASKRDLKASEKCLAAAAKKLYPE